MNYNFFTYRTNETCPTISNLQFLRKTRTHKSTMLFNIVSLDCIHFCLYKVKVDRLTSNVFIGVDKANNREYYKHMFYSYET